MPKLDSISNSLLTIFVLLLGAVRFIGLSLRQRSALAAENLFLRKQLALCLERKVKPSRAKAASKLTLVLLSKLFPWPEALTIVKPDTFFRWHRKGFRLFWRWKSKPRGRPRVPAQLRQLILEMANENPTGVRRALLLNRCWNWGLGSHLGQSDAICPMAPDRDAAPRLSVG